MANPQIIVPEYRGIHTLSPASVERLEKGKTYSDLSTIIVCPTRGMISAKVVQCWMGLIKPMNQKIIGPIFVVGMEVGEAYTRAIDMVLNNPELSKWKYILTIEEDNLPPPDGLMKLYENIEDYSAIGGLYWTKGEGGQPMIYGEGRDGDLHFRPQKPVMDIQPCDGLGMGFTLFKMEVFKDPKIEKPIFKTFNEFVPGKGTKMYTQDLYFFEKIRKLGYKVACDTRVKVGHYDVANDVVW